MISSLASSSSFTATCSSTQQGGLLRKPMTQIKGLNLRYREPKNLLQRSSVKISATLSNNIGKTDELVSRNNDPLTTYVSLAAEQAEQGDNAVVQEQTVSDPLTVIAKKWDAFYRFTRPYTIYGTIVGILSISLLPIQSMADFSPAFFYGLVKTIIPTVLVNIYMCGINQIVDIDIDKINKPTLPLASGEFSLAEGTAITALSAMAALLMAATFNSPPLLLGVMSIFFIATAYSVDLPLLRWKAKPYLTCLSIIGIRALTIPLAFFAHVQKYVLGRPLVYTKPVLFTVAFMTIIATIIAVIKDLPDVEGDEAFGLRSPTTIFGRDKIFWGCVYLLMGTYGGAAVLGATSPLLINKIITVVGHGALAAVLWTRAKSVNIKEPSETLAFYLFIWKLLYAEYFVIPFVR